MIQGPGFIYLHFPKTAGTKVAQLFRRHFADQEGIHIDAEDPAAVIWHDSIRQRVRRDPGFDPGDRTVVVGLRRLSGWLHSRYAFELHRSPHLPHDPQRLVAGEFLEVCGKSSQADLYMRKYLPPVLLREGPVQVIRTEHFAGDFRAVFGRWLDLSAIDDAEFAAPVNRGPLECPEARQVIERHRDRIRAACPHWSAVEARFYGPEGGI